MKRREIKDAHEKSVLSSLQKLFSNMGKNFTVISQPDPPDALVTIDGEKSWVEITDAIFNSEYAKSITSYPANDVIHTPCEPRFHSDPDYSFEKIVINVVKKKYQKVSISNVFKENGPGILLVGLYSPFFDEAEIPSLLDAVKNIINSNDSRFAEVYLYDREHNFFKVI